MGVNRQHVNSGGRLFQLAVHQSIFDKKEELCMKSMEVLRPLSQRLVGGANHPQVMIDVDDWGLAVILPVSMIGSSSLNVEPVPTSL